MSVQPTLWALKVDKLKGLCAKLYIFMLIFNVLKDIHRCVKYLNSNLLK